MKTPIAFLDFLRTHYSQRLSPGLASPQYQRIHRQQEAQAGAAGIDPAVFLDNYLSDTVAGIADMLPSPIARDIRTCIAVGTLDHVAVNAMICRARSLPVYAIVVNRGFISMVNQYAKLISAANHPAEVIFYQGLNLAGLERSTYSQAAQRMIAEYSRTGTVRGPELKLKLGSNAMMRAEFILRQISTFTLAHEIGHYVNGDLAKGRRRFA